MRRWRAVGLLGVPTADGRIIEGPISIRRPVVPLGRVRRRARGHEGASYEASAPVRVQGGEIQALLRWRDRTATPAFQLGKIETPEVIETAEGFELDGPIVLRSPELIALCVAGPSAWEELR